MVTAPSGAVVFTRSSATLYSDNVVMFPPGLNCSVTFRTRPKPSTVVSGPLTVRVGEPGTQLVVTGLVYEQHIASAGAGTSVNADDTLRVAIFGLGKRRHLIPVRRIRERQHVVTRDRVLGR